MLKCGYLVECWVCDEGVNGWGGRIMQSLHVFSSFSDYFAHNIAPCVLISLFLP